MIKKILILSIFFSITTVAYGASKWTSKWITVTATAYCPGACCCGKYADGKTATGRDASKYGVAVDPKVIPLGSRLDIPGYSRHKGIWIPADDVGGKIKGYRIDVRFKTHDEAVKFGKKKLRIRVWIRKEKK